jgi:hypothetical protein
VETFASGPAIAAMGLKAVVQGQATKIGELVNYDLNKITAHVIATAAEAGEKSRSTSGIPPARTLVVGL